MSYQPSARAQIIARRTYSRPTNEAGTTFETWAETIDRVIMHQRWLWERALGDRPLNQAQLDELEALRQLMLARKATVSGRTLWLGGTEVSRRRESSQFNPLPESTRFITDRGVFSFGDFKDGDDVRVITHTGAWQNGKVMFAGTRNMLRMQLRRGRTVVQQDTSVEHTWILNTGKRVEAKDLQIGDRLHVAPTSTFYNWDFDTAPTDEQFWWCYGFVYGDGAINQSGGSITSRVRLCGDKAAYLPRFEGCGFQFSFPPSCKGDPFVYTGSYLKTLPEDGADSRLIRAFLQGYLAADGNKAYRHGKTVIIGLATTCQEAADFVVRWLPVFGVYVVADRQVERETNHGIFKGRELSFSTFGDVGGNLWTVEWIFVLDPQPCWCLTVENDHSFVLPNGIVTGNCSFLRVATVHDVVDAFWLLLQGCGVGFEPVIGTLNGFTQPATVEIIHSERDKLVQQRGRETNREGVVDGVWHLQIGDSAEAWAKAAGKIMAQKAPFHKVVLDFSQIRPAGFRLRGYGWISSGDRTLKIALEAICKIMSRRAGQLLDRIDILDIVNWLGTTLSSRRSAEIALVPYGDPQWRQFATAKKDYWSTGNIQRGQSNNSLVFYSKPSKHDLRDIVQMMIDAGGSEPGFINGEQALERAPWFKGCNPCLTGDTLVPVHRQGLKRIADLAGQTVLVRDGNEEWTEAEFKKTGENVSLLKVELSDGSVYRVTPSHNFVDIYGHKVSAFILKPGHQLMPPAHRYDPDAFGSFVAPENAYRDAWLIADGTWHNNSGSSKRMLYSPKHKYKEALEAIGARFTGPDAAGRYNASFVGLPCPDKAHVPAYVLEGNEETVKAFLRGAIESDGHMGHTSKGWTIQFASIHRSFLQDLQALLSQFGIRGKIALMHPAGTKMLPDGRGGHAPYECQDCWRLTVGNAVRFLEVSFPAEVKRGSYDKPLTISVVSVTALEEKEDVYCCGVPTTSSFDLPTVHSGNCAEILLGDKSFCNLVELDLGKFNGDQAGLEQAFYVITRANYRQTCVNLIDGVLQSTWHELNQFLRLCGVGVTGIVRWEGQTSPAAWQRLRFLANESANSMADELHLPRPKAVTTIKPSGTLSKVMDTTEGLHRPLGEHIFNNVRFSGNDPLLSDLEKAGYYIFQDPYSAADRLVRCPVKWEGVGFSTDERGKRVNVESAIDQLNRYKMVMNNYVDHNASVTISYSVDEADALSAWIHKNWDSYVGVSFLFRNDPSKTAEDLGYPYLPQEVVTEEVFEAYARSLKPISIDGETRTELADVDLADLEIDAGSECAGGVCPVR